LQGLHVDGATKWGGAKILVGYAVMGELCVGDRVAVGANNWGAQSWGILLDGAPLFLAHGLCDMNSTGLRNANAKNLHFIEQVVGRS